MFIVIHAIVLKLQEFSFPIAESNVSSCGGNTLKVFSSCQILHDIPFTHFFPLFILPYRPHVCGSCYSAWPMLLILVAKLKCVAFNSTKLQFIQFQGI